MQRFKKIFADYRETFVVLVGEVIVSALTAAVYLLLGFFDYTVITGAALGSGVIVLNILALSIAVNRSVNKFLKLRGTKQMSDEEAEAFAAEHAASIQLAAKGSYIARTLMMVAALVVALLLGDYFDVIATVIPLLAYRPIIYVSELIRMKIGNKTLQNQGFCEDQTLPSDDSCCKDESDVHSGDTAEEDNDEGEVE